MRKVLGGLCLLALAGSGVAGAQTIRFGVHGVSLTHNEVKKEKGADGTGFGGVTELRVGRLHFEAKVYHAQLSPWLESDTVEFKATQLDIRVSFRVAPGIALEAGGGRRWIRPELAAQEVGFIRLGAVSENQVARIASVWVRGAYLVRPQFGGGGEAGLAVELGLGAGVGTANGRFRVRAEYEFQRIDRRSYPQGLEIKVPIQMAVARFGVELGLW
ncbi:MAG: hypothetical protein GTN62_00240 [Gemmatimonadales bacterium]|nr:hypothetical protein [Gemmatimonadales bacterium]NIN09834.1 hypothetical protein [Gemmatimonadales bacterium]NIN48537.1 hypothetical protein [Gemmatimonadales bacterium]NIP06001.1 hypothetical protein [Gemmatimonadales bacterium]NIR01151.1 hypothetical protein [Gemmatimonadales bacterium]